MTDLVRSQLFQHWPRLVFGLALERGVWSPLLESAARYRSDGCLSVGMNGDRFLSIKLQRGRSLKEGGIVVTSDRR